MNNKFNFSIEKNVYDVSLKKEVTKFYVTISKGYYPLPNEGGGDMTNYYTKTQSDARFKPINYQPNWNDIVGKPLTFIPKAHSHIMSDVAGLQAALNSKLDSTALENYYTKTESDNAFRPMSYVPSWSEITNKPTSFTPSTHTHDISDVNGLQAELNSKLESSALTNYYTKTESDLKYKLATYTPTWSEISGKPTSFTPTTHASTHENGGTDQISGQNLYVLVSSSNYSPTSNTLQGHLIGVDSELGEYSIFKAGILDGTVNPVLSRSSYTLISGLDSNGWAKQMAWISHDDKRLHVADIETGQSHATLDDRDLKTFGVSDALIQFARGIYEGTHIINTGVFVSMQVLVNYGTNPRQITLKFTINSEANVLTAKGYKLKINNTTSAAQVNLNFATAGTEGTTVLVFIFNDTALMEHTTGVQEFEIYKDGVDESGVPSVNWINEYKQDKLSTITGNVGVGKDDAAATEKLDVAGRVKSDGVVINETTSAILPREIKFKGGNFVGAGNDGVEKKFLREGESVSLPTGWIFGLGNLSIATNTAIGKDALKSNTSGAYNLAIGNQAMTSNTTGASNTAIGGDLTMGFNTTGSNNTAIGNASLQSNLTGGSNTAVGRMAGYSSTGNNNTFIGYWSGKNYTGNEATFVGYGSGGTGVFSVAVGFNAGANQSGGFSVYIGHSSGSSITTGSRNIAIGHEAMTGAHTTSSQNVAIGWDSMANWSWGTSGNTTSNYNTCVGYQSGSSPYVGDYNIFIGHGASTTNNNSSRVSKRIVIGSSSMMVGNTIDDYPISVNMESAVPYGKHNYKNLPLRFQLPNLTKAQRDALTSKTIGEMIWQTDTGNSGIRVYNGTNWLAIQTTID